MKFIHLSDLHLGKRVNEFSMLDDQKHILQKILEIVECEKPDAVVIAGDVYDKTVPSAEAVLLLDEFLFALSQRSCYVLVISGNHDSAERIAFASRLIKQSGVYFSPVYNGKTEPVVIGDEFGEVRFYMLPFVKPSTVRACFEDEKAESYNEAVRVAVEKMQADSTCRNILVTHQFVVGAERCESEDISVGGTDGVDASVFDNFDYVALGHLHAPQQVFRETVRYCGTPLKYSFSEASHCKSVPVVEIKEKGNVSLHTVPLVPLHDLREITGTYMQLTSKAYYESLDRDDYYHITLTDENDIPGAISKLRVIYKNIMRLDYDNTRTKSSSALEPSQASKAKTPIQLFEELYEKQNNMQLTNEQQKYMEELVEKLREAEL